MFKDKVVFIIGAGSGIGRHRALESARRGAIVWATDIDAAVARAVGDECRATGARVRERTLGVTDAAAVERAIAELVAADARLDYCFNDLWATKWKGLAQVKKSRAEYRMVD